MKLEVLDIKGKKLGRSVDLPDDIFGAEPNDHVLYLAVKQFLADQRQGTHKTKTRKEVKGSSRKLHRQKGTGGSRKGNIRNPLYKGGGTVFGPQPRSYSFKLNKKVKDLARVSALSYKAKDNAIFVVEDFSFDTPKTKSFLAILTSLGIDTKKILFLGHESNPSHFLSLRNLGRVVSDVVHDFNTYDVLHSDVILLTESAAKLFVQPLEEQAEESAKQTA